MAVAIFDSRSAIEMWRHIEGHGWTLAGVHADRALSGASRFRSAYQELLREVEARACDVVVCEALDRLGRNLSDVSALHDRLEFLGIALHAVNLGRVTTMHVGLLGTMAQLYLSDLKDKTKRGQLGRALAGRIPGGNAFGYDLIDGETGTRRINRAEAAVIERIFRDYAAGRSPRAIAKALNAEGVPGPKGREWRDTMVRGQADRGTGILNNALYIGRLEWNRSSYVKDPRSGKRVARPNPRELWEIVEVPALRIVDWALWERVKQRQQSVTFEVGRDQTGQPLNRAHRRRFLLSGLIKCGLCGGGYTIMAADLVTACLEEFRTHINQAAREAEARLVALRRERKVVDSKIEGILKAIEDGMYAPSLKERMAALEARRSQKRRLLRIV